MGADGRRIAVNGGMYYNTSSVGIPETVAHNGVVYDVTAIGDGAFWYSEYFTSITIPNSVTAIGAEAFYNCSGLTDSFIIPDSVTDIGAEAFYYCLGLRNVVVTSEDTALGRTLDLSKDDPREGADLLAPPCGDMNGDGSVDSADLAMLWMSGNYNKPARPDGSEDAGLGGDPLCGLNGDRLINSADLAVLWNAANYNKGERIIEFQRRKI